MCPECYANLALIYAGVASTGTLVVFAVKRLYARIGANPIRQNNHNHKKQGEEQYERSENRLTN